ncbi:MAG: hypothetical protein LBV71_00210 [Prevotella sp.]|nr:hypothetical protein [Prevotella sp.]
MATLVLSNKALTDRAVLLLPVALPDVISQRDMGTLTLALNCTIDFPMRIRPKTGTVPSAFSSFRLR